MLINNFEKKQAINFFKNLKEEYYKNFKTKSIQLLIVGHILPDTISYYNILDELFDIIYIIPKPNSINPEALEELNTKGFPILKIDREDLRNNPSFFLRKLKNKVNKQFIVLDIGGYFSPLIEKLKREYGGIFLGVIEDTENGHQKYEQLKNSSIPIFSVARSPLKNPEDYLVGQSIVFSAEYVLRMNNNLLNNKEVGVIGFGKIGRSIAQNLFIRNIKTKIYDSNPQQQIQAYSYGYDISSKREFLKNSSIIFCATGNSALEQDDFQELSNGTYIASVTSSDDEMDLHLIKNQYKISKINEFTDLYQGNKNYFYLLNKGNAINFLHNAVVGSFIYLIQAEIFVLIKNLATFKGGCDNIFECRQEIRNKIATIWIKCFTKKS